MTFETYSSMDAILTQIKGNWMGFVSAMVKI